MSEREAKNLEGGRSKWEESCLLTQRRSCKIRECGVDTLGDESSAFWIRPRV